MSQTACKPVPIPETVNLYGIRHKVQQSEDLIIFSEVGAAWSTYSRLSFERRCGCWYVSISSSSNDATVAHITKAFEFVRAAYGDDFEMQNGPDQP